MFINLSFAVVGRWCEEKRNKEHEIKHLYNYLTNSLQPRGSQHPGAGKREKGQIFRFTVYL